jgi:TatD DNase family protein
VIDSHCHLDVSAFAADRDAVLARAAAAGVSAIIVPGVDRASWGPIAELAESPVVPVCYAAFGIHPVTLPERAPAHDDEDLEELGGVLSRHRAVAVGECGLDSTIDLERAPMERQVRVLRAQLALAKERDLPVILHARGPRTYELLAGLLDESCPPRGGVVHSYGGGADVLRRYLRHPLFFGFAGPATWPNARKIRASIAAVPADRLLAETDAPDQAPEGRRPGRSEPAFVAEIVAGLAAARGEQAAALGARTAENARRLFRLP